MGFWASLISIVLPPRCAVTGDIVDAQGMISPKAWGNLRFISEPYCVTCGIPFDVDQAAPMGVVDTLSYQKCAPCLSDPPFYDSARAAVTYDDTSRGLILAFKHGDQTHLTVTFTPWLETIIRHNQFRADYIVPVPLHWTRLFKRRYNQAALLANALSRASGIPARLDDLKRTRATVTQGHLPAKERAANVKNAFALREKNKNLYSGKTIILIDDVYTTGATIHECVRILKNAGAECVIVITIARVMRDGAGA